MERTDGKGQFQPRMTAAVLISLAAATFWGLADFGGGLASRRLPVAAVLLGTQLVGLVISLALVVASGAQAPGSHAALASLAAGLAGAAGLGCFYRSLATGSMSIVAPIAATGAALPVLVGVLGGEVLRIPQAAGLALASAGVVLASRQAEQQAVRSGAAGRRPIGLALLAALGFGLYFTGAHAGTRGGALWMLLLSHGSAAVLISAAVLAARVELRISAPDRRRLLGIGLLDMSATGLYALANRHGLLSVVAVVGSLYPVATVALARVVLHERISRGQGAGVALALGGVALLAGG